MEQTRLNTARTAPVGTYAHLKRLRPKSLSIHFPRVKSVSAATMSSYNNRALSPGGRRIQNSARLSDQSLTDPAYYGQRHNSYASPRVSTSGVIPISTQTFINLPPPQSARPAQQYDSYSGRPRRSSLVDTTRGTTTTSTARARPTIIQQDITRPTSPTKITTSLRDKDYYVTPASSQDSRSTATTHKKLYSVDGDGSAKLVADVNIPVEAGGNRHHKRRDSVDRSGYRQVVGGAERDRGRRNYHPNGSHNRPRDKDIDDEDAFSYTDPASMYRDTEPRWRAELQRPRRGSMDRGGAMSRERPVSLLDPTFIQRQPVTKDVGPPPSTRGWGKINDNLGRTGSVREEPPRRIAQSPSRGRTQVEYMDPRDQYYVAPRTNSNDRRGGDFIEYELDPRRERRHSVTRNDRPGRFDQSVERRGFGLRPEVRADSLARDTRGSDESFERGQRTEYRDSGYAEPHRRDTAPPELSRLEQEKRDREYATRLQAEDRDRPRDSHAYVAPVQPRRDERAFDRDYDRERDRPRDRDYDRDREREKERARQLEPPSQRDDKRHHERRGTDRGDHDRKGDSPRQSGETLSKPSLSQAATGGLAGAAAAFGLTNLVSKIADKRDKDKDVRDESKDRDRDRHYDRRDDDREREREKERDRERERERERDRTRRPASDEPPHERQQDRDRHKEQDRGLGFAFETPSEPPRSAPPTQVSWPPEQKLPPQDRPQVRMAEQVPRSSDRMPEQPLPRPVERMPEGAPRPVEREPERPAAERQSERVNQDYDSKPAVQMPAPAIDADEDYRRRMEQVQKELGRPVDVTHNSDSDPDRERRRREREQRQRERENRNGTAGGPYSDYRSTEMAAMPGSFHDDMSTVTGTTATDSMANELRRKPSILDQPFTGEQAHIIDNSMSDRRENHVRIVDPPTEEEERRPRGILKKPTSKFPEDPNAVREGVAPLKDVSCYRNVTL